MPENFNLFNRNGLKIVGDLYEAGQPCHGLVFVQHGLGGYRKQSYITTLSEALQNNGYTVVAFDSTNSFGESDGKLENATLSNHARDLEDVISWSKDQDFYQEPFSLVGHSLGGASVFLYTLHHPDKVKTLAPLSMVTGYNAWEEVFKTYRENEWKEWQTQGYLEKSDQKIGKSGRISTDFLEDLKLYDLVAQAHLIKTPVFMAVGSKDPTTPVKTQESIFQKLQLETQNVSAFHIINEAGHTFDKDQDIKILTEKLYLWLKQQTM
jgi:pimeloyl-ACP methyl ester carboxylesterase